MPTLETPFLTFWRALNAELTARGQPETNVSEATARWRSDDRYSVHYAADTIVYHRRVRADTAAYVQVSTS
jgi:hypothetical protein